MVTARTWIGIAAAVALFGALAYLRDPPWLIHQTVGLRPWQTSAVGTRFRWSGQHSSFFLPSNAGIVHVPVSTTFDENGHDPMIVTFWIDDVRTARVLLDESGWHDVVLDIPPRRHRRVVRVDVRTSVVRPDNHGVMIGEISCCSAPRTS